MWEEPQVHSNLMFPPSLVVRAPKSREKRSLPPRVSMCCYAPSSLRGAKTVHTIIKFLKSFLFYPQRPNHQASVWLPSGWPLLEPALLSSQTHVGQVSPLLGVKNHCVFFLRPFCLSSERALFPRSSVNLIFSSI